MNARHRFLIKDNVQTIVDGWQKNGPHLYETCPSGNYYDYYAQAMGARSQSAKTYLEKTFKEFENGWLLLTSLLACAFSLKRAASREDLIRHALLSLRETCGSQSEGLTSANTTLGIVGEGEKFTILEDELLQPYVSS